MRHSEWHDLAATLDRIFFIAFSVTILVVSLLILSKRPPQNDRPWEQWPNEAVFH